MGRLARTFPAQIEALNRYHNNGEPAITVQNVSVQDGGEGHRRQVTQHASVIVSKKPAGLVTDGLVVPTPDSGGGEHHLVRAGRKAQAKAQA